MPCWSHSTALVSGFLGCRRLTRRVVSCKACPVPFSASTPPQGLRRTRLFSAALLECEPLPPALSTYLPLCFILPPPSLIFRNLENIGKKNHILLPCGCLPFDGVRSQATFMLPCAGSIDASRKRRIDYPFRCCHGRDTRTVTKLVRFRLLSGGDKNAPTANVRWFPKPQMLFWTSAVRVFKYNRVPSVEA